jgi:hypothetical protein
MKTLFTFALVTALAFSLSGCLLAAAGAGAGGMYAAENYKVVKKNKSNNSTSQHTE